MGLNLYLQSQKQAIATGILLQNASAKKNTDVANNFDFSDSKISIFSSQVKEAIRAKALQCNDSSSKIVMNKTKDQEQVAGNCSDVNSKVIDLQSLISWAGAASQEIANIPGISESAMSSINQNMGAAVQYGSSVISNVVSHATEALSKINAPENKAIETVVKSAQNNIQTAAQEVTTTFTANSENEPFVNTQNGTAATTENKIENKTEAAPVEKKTENKTEAAPVEKKTEIISVETDNPFALEKQVPSDK